MAARQSHVLGDSGAANHNQRPEGKGQSAHTDSLLHGISSFENSGTN
jgi:hypothetical protein